MSLRSKFFWVHVVARKIKNHLKFAASHKMCSYASALNFKNISFYSSPLCLQRWRGWEWGCKIKLFPYCLHPYALSYGRKVARAAFCARRMGGLNKKLFKCCAARNYSRALRFCDQKYFIFFW